MQEARELRIHLGQYETTYSITEDIPNKKLSEVIAKLKQIGENNSVAVLRPGEREDGFYGGTGIDSLDKERFDTFLSQADELVERYAQGRSMRVVDETMIKPIHRGSLIMGIIGALLGGLVGAVAFAIVAYIGFFISYLGFVIAIAATKGYDLLGGKQGASKRIVLIVVIFISVVAGFIMANSASYANALSVNFITGFRLFWQTFLQAPRVLFNMSFFIGLAFAYLGAWGVIRSSF